MNAPILTTDRLRLRMPAIEDEVHFSKFMMSQRSQFVGGPTTHGRAWRAFAHVVGQWDMRGYGIWTMESKASRHAVGWCGIYHPSEMEEPEISWSIWDEAEEGKGFAYEAALAVRSHVYQAHGWNTITSNIDAGNTRSENLAKRLGCWIESSYTEEPDDILVNLYRHPSAEGLA